ncbi:MAG TPA: hypothetical protein VNT81_22080 [Vicinamibacterales bacterium]|nr:hypothetical protein [Vicinamibacterales bacterium]
MTVSPQTREAALASIAYAALTFLMTLPFSLSAGSHVNADIPDTHLYIWTLAWDTYALIHQPLQIFDANIYYPFANTLAYSENLIGSVMFAAPVIWLTGNLVLATNLTAFITCMLSGTGAFVLARRLHLTLGAAFLCGLLFAFAPPRFYRLGQLHLTAVQWIPFSLAFLHSYFEAGRRRDLLIATGFFSLQVLSSGHGAAYLVISIALLLAWQFGTGAPLALKQRLKDFGAAGAYLIAPAVWIILPYRIAQDEAGLRRGYLSGSQPGIESLLASPARVHQFLQAKFLGPFEKEPEAFLFPGILVLLLAGVALTAWPSRSRLRSSPLPFYLLLAILSTLMFVDWPFELWRYVYWLPGFNFIRVPSRFMILTMLALSVLAAIGFDRLAAWLKPAQRTIAAAVVAMLMLAENTVYPFPSVPYQVNIPAIDRWLDSQPKPFVVAEVPVPRTADLGALERQQTQAMLHATAHWQKTIHGYSGIRRKFHDELYDALSSFPDRDSMAGLRAAGVTYVVVHSAEYGSRWPSVEENIKATPGLRLTRTDGPDRVYTLVPE